MPGWSRGCLPEVPRDRREALQRTGAGAFGGRQGVATDEVGGPTGVVFVLGTRPEGGEPGW